MTKRDFFVIFIVALPVSRRQSAKKGLTKAYVDVIIMLHHALFAGVAQW
ncbi:hypothetical protein GF312_01230 [Candidatus Poribacteria bacterium]|nr:hypothetical protein [Candidatus Poribacteria bacterium]